MSKVMANYLTFSVVILVTIILALPLIKCSSSSESPPPTTSNVPASVTSNVLTKSLPASGPTATQSAVPKLKSESVIKSTINEKSEQQQISRSLQPSVTSTSNQIINSTFIDLENVADINLAPAIFQFGVNILQSINANEKTSSSIIMSPLSVQMALALIFCGAKGRTATAMKSSLQLGSFTNINEVANDFFFLLTPYQNMNKQYDNAIVEIVNAIYIMDGYDIRKTFQQIAEHKFYSKVSSVNFTQNQNAARAINSWVSEETHGKISNLIAPSTLDSQTGLVLVNAIYFHAYWHQKFSASRTVNGSKFYASSSTFKKVDMMNQDGLFQYLYMNEHKVKVIKLPYYSSDMVMLIFLPDDYNNGINKLDVDIQSFNLSSIYQKMSSYQVQLSLPRFTISFDVDLKNELTQMGMGIMFDQYNANFNGILKHGSAGSSPSVLQPLYVAQVRHKAHIEVNERGTVAAAATELHMAFPHKARRFPQHPKSAVFNANHSFLFLILNSINFDVIFTGQFIG